MITVFAVIWMTILLSLCGLGPTLLLLRRRSSPFRILVLPSVGLSSGVLLSMVLAQFGFTGRTVAKLDLLVFSALAVIGLLKAPPLRSELKRAIIPGLVCLFAAILITWPLFHIGHTNYLGYGNPDVPALLKTAVHLESHPFGLPGHEMSDRDYYRGARPDIILGISYFFFMFDVTTGVPVHLLFSIACATVVFFSPASVYSLAEEGFGLKPGIALAAALALACSSLMANTFYLHSLGTLCTIAVGPVLLALAIRALSDPGLGTPVLLAIVCAGAYYNYYAGLAPFGVLVATAVVGRLVQRSVAIGRAAQLAALVSAIALLAFAPYAANIVRNYIREASAGMLLAKQDEIQGFFALALTERVLPFSWGLTSLTLDSPFSGRWLGISVVVAFAMGFFCSALLLLSLRLRISHLPSHYACMLCGFLAVVVFYTARGAGYGVLKLVTWAHPLTLVGLTAAALGLAGLLHHRGLHVPAAALICLMVAVGGWNACRTYRLADFSIGHDPRGTDSILPGFTLADFRDVGAALRAGGHKHVVGALADPVLNYWVDPFVGGNLSMVPVIPLAVSDSAPLGRPQLEGLIPNTAEQAVLLTQIDTLPANDRCPPLWKNRVFAFAALSSCRDTLALGTGWYRQQAIANSPFLWERRFHWLRKRGEAFLINPSHGSYRAALTAVAGYGNPSPYRHLRLYVNGAPVEDISLAGYARVITQPFEVSPRINQIELEVREDAQPLPRQWALWNRHIPRDPRRLNIAVPEFRVFPADTGTPLNPASTVELTAQTPLTTTVHNGIYADGWVGPHASIQLRMPCRAKRIQIAGSIPGVATLKFPYRFQVYLASHLADVVELPDPGEFSRDVLIPQELQAIIPCDSAVAVDLSMPATFVNTRTADRRPLSIHLRSLAFVTDTPGSASFPRPPDMR